MKVSPHLISSRLDRDGFLARVDLEAEPRRLGRALSTVLRRDCIGATGESCRLAPPDSSSCE